MFASNRNINQELSTKMVRNTLFDPKLQLPAVSALIMSYIIGAGVIDPGPFPPVCPFRLITGLQCPLCGLTHSLHYLFNGNWSSAIDNHPLVLPILALLLYIAAASLFIGTTKKGYFDVRIILAATSALSIGTVAARMIA